MLLITSLIGGYCTPTLSEAVEPIVRLVLVFSLKEVLATTHLVIEVSHPVLFLLFVGQCVASPGPMGTVVTAVEAVTTKILPLTIIKCDVVPWIPCAC